MRPKIRNHSFTRTFEIGTSLEEFMQFIVSNAEATEGKANLRYRISFHEVRPRNRERQIQSWVANAAIAREALRKAKIKQANENLIPAS